MECQPHEKLEALERIMQAHYANLSVSYEISSDNSPYMCIFEPQKTNSYLMNFLPMFYLIGSVDENSKLSLKLITHHGKVLKELNEDKSVLQDSQKIDFIGSLMCLEPCHGVRVLDYDLKLDPYTFTCLYLVEQIGQNIVIRSRQCQFALNTGNKICDACSNLDKQCIIRNEKICELGNIDSMVEGTCLQSTWSHIQRNVRITENKEQESYNLSLIHNSEPTRLGMNTYAVFC